METGRVAAPGEGEARAAAWSRPPSRRVGSRKTTMATTRSPRTARRIGGPTLPRRRTSGSRAGGSAYHHSPEPRARMGSCGCLRRRIGSAAGTRGPTRSSSGAAGSLSSSSGSSSLASLASASSSSASASASGSQGASAQAAAGTQSKIVGGGPAGPLARIGGSEEAALWGRWGQLEASLLTARARERTAAVVPGPRSSVQAGLGHGDPGPPGLPRHIGDVGGLSGVPCGPGQEDRARGEARGVAVVSLIDEIAPPRRLLRVAAVVLGRPVGTPVAVLGQGHEGADRGASARRLSRFCHGPMIRRGSDARWRAFLPAEGWAGGEAAASMAMRQPEAVGAPGCDVARSRM